MDSDARPDRNALPLRRSRSAGDFPLTSQASPLDSSSTHAPRSAGPSFPQFQHTSIDASEITIQSPQPVVSPSHDQPLDHVEEEGIREQGLPPRQYPAHRSLIYRAMIYLGYGRGASPTRKILVSLIWNLAWGFTQVVVIIGLLAFAASHNSPTEPNISEWNVCDRPLGVWASLWIGRVLVASILSYLLWKRDTVARLNAPDPEAGSSNAVHTSPPSRRAPTTHSQGSIRRTNTSSQTRSNSSQTPPLPHARFYRRLSLFSSLYSLTWFLTAHIMVYTSINRCRYSAPHLWWLVFGILCITYLMILEVVILGIIVFIIGPIILLVWNIFLICIGRHPLQNPHMIKPEIGKLPKSVVDQIPLVMYIPPPPNAPLSEGPIKIPDAAYMYPPKSPQTSAITPPRRRFKFIKFSKSKKAKEGGTKDAASSTKESPNRNSWEDLWEKEGYPFVVLENNRAACAVCLMDFEEPKRVNKETETKNTTENVTLVVESGLDSEPHITEETREENTELRLEDAGEGAQPLRLLTCGHVFHKTCLDPWLTDVSGRCPVCQRPVEVPEPKKKKGGR